MVRSGYATLIVLQCASAAYTGSIASRATPPDLTSCSAHQGEWAAAKLSLRNPSCCVVSVSGLDYHLSVLKEHFCSPGGPSDLDLRMRVRCGENEVRGVGISRAYEDCYKIYKSITEPSSVKDSVNEFCSGFDVDPSGIPVAHPCVLALEALARGVSSLADGPLEGVCTDVHMRVVFASSYEAKDPMFHTDKCPLRGYVTLAGPGTEYMNRTCFPWEYAALRTLGAEDSSHVKGLRVAESFIVMKGDYYDAPLPDGITPSVLQKVLGKVWMRGAACVHRSPPADGRSWRRVILSLDLADGGDDQEWYEYNKKRGWRSGMTQRKSRLVA
ncbi:hypothetical protein HJC23_009178 [Cyclotella cryptica]|uniref:Uncharacterized protein n=1 Tax=Cyclotella cryptica TaxID=29204 RepID=A0ABD3PKV1_9STRA|eukprot:CCRYP_013788-RA/>CCRYP_013788-RA protein AED:0.00 eAED:0.00 QI:450/-1/1/1/-1/1/1/694/327